MWPYGLLDITQAPHSFVVTYNDHGHSIKTNTF